MRKELLALLCVVGLVLLGVTSVRAATWQIMTSDTVAKHGPGPDKVIGTGDDTSSGEDNNCNFSDASDCAASSSPTLGTYSYAKLGPFTMTSSCALGDKRGQSCSSDSECGGLPGSCVACGSGAYSYFYKVDGAAQNRGVGKFTTAGCTLEGGGTKFDYTSMNIGTSEAIPSSGGGCITLKTGGGQTTGQPCGTGNFTSTVDLELWVINPINGTKCGFDAGAMPGITLNGAVFKKGTTSAYSVCGYQAAGINSLLANISTGQYLMVSCTSQTLPTVQTACLSGAPFTSKIVAWAASGAENCSAACSGGGCAGGAAAGAE